jgi:hypothetical protein
MKYCVNSVKKRTNMVKMANIGGDKLDAIIAKSSSEIMLCAAGHVIDNDNPGWLAVQQQLINNSRANQACTAGDEDLFIA